MRLPSGYSSLRCKKLGGILRAERKKRRIKQAVLASDVGIRREALSRIENGRQTPRPRVLDALMGELNIEWDQVACRGPARRPARIFEEGTRGDALIALGNEIHRRRRKEGLSLSTLGDRLHLSAAQLSRVERGQVLRSRLFRDRPSDRAFDREERRIEVIDSALKAFLEI